MQIFVKAYTGRTLKLGIEDLSCSVEDVKQEICRREKILPFEQRLCFGGRELRRHANGPSRTVLKLADYGVQNDSTLHLLLRIRGSALLGKNVKGRAKAQDANMYSRMREQSLHEQKYLDARNALKLRLSQEQANTRINKLKIQNQWRKIMRPEKAESLKKEIEILSQNHERDVDRKDAIIQMLDRDLEEAEDQYQMNLRTHLQNMDRLIDLQDTRLLALEQEFEKDLRTLEDDFSKERKTIIKQHAIEVDELEYIMEAVRKRERELELEATQEHEQIREEIKNKNLEEINMLRIQLDSQIEDLEQKFENAHLNYLQTTDKRTADFKYYTKRDQEVSKDVEVKIRSIERLQSSLNQCRQRYSTAVKECSARNALLIEEKNKLQGRFQQNKMNKFREGQAKKLAELSRITTESKKILQEKITLAESILKSAELARKLETEREKVIPFDLGADVYDMDSEMSITEKQQNDSIQEELGKSADRTQPLPWQSAALHPTTGAVVPKWEQLHRHLKKYNKVLFEKLAVDRENQRLKDENARFQEMLQQYMNGISVNDTVMDDPENPLLVINGRVRLERPLPVARQENITVMDANQLVATSCINTTCL